MRLKVLNILLFICGASSRLKIDFLLVEFVLFEILNGVGIVFFCFLSVTFFLLNLYTLL